MGEVLGDTALGGMLVAIAVVAVVGAILVGAVVGVLRASRRRRPSRPSVYEVIRERLEADAPGAKERG